MRGPPKKSRHSVTYVKQVPKFLSLVQSASGDIPQKAPSFDPDGSDQEDEEEKYSKLQSHKDLLTRLQADGITVVDSAVRFPFLFLLIILFLSSFSLTRI